MGQQVNALFHYFERLEMLLDTEVYVAPLACTQTGDRSLQDPLDLPQSSSPHGYNCNRGVSSVSGVDAITPARFTRNFPRVTVRPISTHSLLHASLGDDLHVILSTEIGLFGLCMFPDSDIGPRNTRHVDEYGEMARHAKHRNSGSKSNRT